MSDRIKFTIGTNFDKNLISNISMIDRNKDFISVFGKLKSDFLGDRKSTRLNSSHANISYAVFCLKKKILRNDPLVGRTFQSLLPLPPRLPASLPVPRRSRRLALSSTPANCPTDRKRRPLNSTPAN